MFDLWKRLNNYNVTATNFEKYDTANDLQKTITFSFLLFSNIFIILFYYLQEEILKAKKWQINSNISIFVGTQDETNKHVLLFWRKNNNNF